MPLSLTITGRDNSQFGGLAKSPPTIQVRLLVKNGIGTHTCDVLFCVHNYSPLTINTMFKRISGDSKYEYFPKKASTAFAQGDLVYADGSGAIQPADSTSGDHLGVIMATVASTDADYASTTKVAVDIISPEDKFEVEVGTGTLTTAMVGNRYDLKDATSIDVTATAKKVITVTDFISGTKAIVKVNAVITSADVATS